MLTQNCNCEERVKIIQDELDSYKKVLEIRLKDFEQLMELHHQVSEEFREYKEEVYARMLCFQQLQNNCRNLREKNKELERILESKTGDEYKTWKRTLKRETGKLQGVNRVLQMRIKTLQLENQAMQNMLNEMRAGKNRNVSV